ncbi:MAG: hypothetical protein H0T92_02685 [Pyrinomonadaceae bacterium]|nr:hypothetical protein [Pyrinomonadaceae bacterium]MBA3715667.1 hypothetical protein [Pyrinomonadaceae bacterium]MDQ3253050.1 hypothetical protein [Acidobacteriota bacterium]
MSLQYLKEAVAVGDTEKLIRYVRLHLGDGNEAAGRKEIDKAWVEALKLLLDVPETDREFILKTLAERDAATLAHLFFHLHFYLVQRSGEWIHDGTL